MNEPPNLSIVLLGRNDDYGGDHLGRMRLCLESLRQSLRECNWEAVLVDYNQVKDKEPLADHFKDFHNINSVVVSRDDHNKFMKRHIKAGGFLYREGKPLPKKPIKKYDKVMKKQPWCGAYAYNAGLRASRGKYILCTSSDNIFPNGLQNIIQRLKPNVVYRARKLLTTYDDVRNNFDNIVNNIPFDLSKKTIKFRRRIMTDNVCKGTGDFLLMHRKNWKKIGGFLPIPQHFALRLDSLLMFEAISYGMHLGICDYAFTNIHDSVAHKGILKKGLHYRLHRRVHYKRYVYDHHSAATGIVQMYYFNQWASKRRFKKFRVLKFKGAKNKRFFVEAKNIFNSFLKGQGIWR